MIKLDESAIGPLLTQEEAQRRLREEPENLAIKISDLMRCYGLTSAEMLSYLREDRIRAERPKRYRGRKGMQQAIRDDMVYCTGTEVNRWLDWWLDQQPSKTTH